MEIQQWSGGAEEWFHYPVSPEYGTERDIVLSKPPVSDQWRSNNEAGSGNEPQDARGNSLPYYPATLYSTYLTPTLTAFKLFTNENYHGFLRLNGVNQNSLRIVKESGPCPDRERVTWLNGIKRGPSTE